MTNYIEQLMKAAGVEKMPVKGYPLFTPSKQLELIKLIVNAKKVKCFYTQSAKGFRTYSFLFENALAELVTNLIVKKRIDKSEVRRILEDDKNYS